MGKTSVQSFDSDVCMGGRADVDGPCRYLADVDDDTGRPIVDRLARAESAALSVAGIAQEGSKTDFKCGCCGCPLVNLELTNEAPVRCPRLDKHQ